MEGLILASSVVLEHGFPTRGHICKLCLCYCISRITIEDINVNCVYMCIVKNYAAISADRYTTFWCFSTCGPRTSPCSRGIADNCYRECQIGLRLRRWGQTGNFLVGKRRSGGEFVLGADHVPYFGFCKSNTLASSEPSITEDKRDSLLGVWPGSILGGSIEFLAFLCVAFRPHGPANSLLSL